MQSSLPQFARCIAIGVPNVNNGRKVVDSPCLQGAENANPVAATLI